MCSAPGVCLRGHGLPDTRAINQCIRGHTHESLLSSPTLEPQPRRADCRAGRATQTCGPWCPAPPRPVSIPGSVLGKLIPAPRPTESPTTDSAVTTRKVRSTAWDLSSPPLSSLSPEEPFLLPGLTLMLSSLSRDPSSPGGCPAHLQTPFWDAHLLGQRQGANSSEYGNSVSVM